MKIDSVRRECEDLGTFLTNEKRLRGVDTAEAMKAIAVIHKKAMSPELAAPETDLSSLLKELDAFRTKFKIDPDVASYR